MTETYSAKQAVDFALGHLNLIHVAGVDCIHMSEAIKMLAALSEQLDQNTKTEEKEG